ncbi:sensor histidine kinase [Leptospira ilyithenensis]|uniref:histidine kinase n=1 Tax=Leptospira ilyithenensis TaxID=2484901 RepID=A0A4R9LP23_9LEPT|nr:histidine kinase dimerization/phosphoacceptor domain -containing protein [Leptospira ilyithenensis]TGN08497.1 response regulator [Leptospira ilyithenensis]
METATFLKKKILLVEDEAIIAMATSRQLEDSFHIVTASSGTKAINYIRSSEDQIDLVLMDIDLGHGMDGTETAKEILEIRDIPIIFVSSHMEPDIVKKTESITSYGYVLKSSGIHILAASIRMAFRLYEARVHVLEKNSELAVTSEELEAANRQLVDSDIELRNTADRFRSTLDSMIEGCQIVGYDWTYLYINESAAKYGRGAISDFLGKSMFECNPGIEKQEVYRIFASCMKNREYCHRDIEFFHSDGSKSYFEFSIQPIKEGLFILTYDVSERKQMEEKLANLLSFKDTLMIELQHRVKNTLAVVSSLLHLESAKIEDKEIKNIFKNTETRILAMAGIYEMLYNDTGSELNRIQFDHYVMRLCKTLANAYNIDDKIQIRYDLNQAEMDLKLAVVLCLVLNELLMNSIKHTYLENGKGEIFVSVKSVSGNLILKVIDNGTGFTEPKTNEQSGIGLSLVQLLIKQIGGVIEIQNANGISVLIEVPLSYQ